MGTMRRDTSLQEEGVPKVQNNIGLVKRRRKKAYKILLPLLDDVGVNIYGIAEALSKAIGPSPKAYSKAMDRRPFSSTTSIEELEGMPFHPMPEQMEPAHKDMSDAIADSIRDDVENPTADGLVKLSWRLAGNVHKLLEGNPILPWDPEYQDKEWCMCEVIDAEEIELTSGERGFEMRVFFFSGAPAGISLMRRFSNGYEARISNKFGLAWKDASMIYPKELVGLQGVIQLSPSRDRDIPYFYQFTATGSQQKANKKLYHDRVDLSNCPYGIKDQENSCADCLVPYRVTGENAIRCDLSVSRRR
jgi:hypothetical protein